MKTLRIAVIALFCLGPLMSQPAAAQPDIVGLRLGMTLEQAQQALRTHNGTVRVRLVNEVLPGGGTRFVSMLWAGVFGDTRAGTGDEVFKLEFSNPPAPRLMAIWRRQTFPQGHELGLENTMAAFREKYGAPRVQQKCFHTCSVDVDCQPAGRRPGELQRAGQRRARTLHERSRRPASQ